MFKYWICFFSVFTFYINTYSQFNSKLITSEQAINDVNYLQIHIQDIHIKYDYFIDNEEFHSNFDSLRNFLDTIDSINLQNFYSLLAPLVHKLSDIHTQLILPKKNLIQSKNKQFLLEFKILNNDFFLRKDNSNNLPAGSKILSINNISSADIIENLISKAPNEANSLRTKERYIEKNFFELFSAYFKQSEKYLIEYIAPNSKEVENKEIIVLGRNKSKIKKLGNYHQLDYYADLNTVFVRIPSFMSLKDDDYKDFLDFVFSHIKNVKADNLIIDFRDNQGGIVEHGRLLLNYLISEPVVYIQNTVLKRSKLFEDIINQKSDITGLSVNRLLTNDMRRISSEVYGTYDTISEKMAYNNQLSFDGKIYVLVNGYSASTTGLVSNALRFDKRAVFVGQQTAFTSKGTFGQIVNFNLPSSGIEVHISTYKFISPTDTNQAEVFVPDILIDDTVEDLITGDDAALKLILQVIKSKK